MGESLGLGETVVLGFRIRRAFPKFRFTMFLRLPARNPKQTASDCPITGAVIGFLCF
jgi:hypothetical protein